MAISNKQKALIHVARAKTGMSEDAYRELLATFGAASSTDLGPDAFDRLMGHFKTLGFQSTSNYRKPVESKKLLMGKIEAIRAELHLSEKYVNGMANRMFQNQDGQPVKTYRWLNARQLHRLVAALTYHQRRQHAQKG
jgi:phage gp16-like protein